MSRDIAYYLEAQGVGNVKTDIFVDYLPDEPVEGVMVRQYAGRPPPLSSPRIRRPNLQILVRDSVDMTAYNKALVIDQILSAVRNQVIGDAYYMSVRPIQEPFSIGWENDMVIFSQNFEVELTMEE